MLTPLATPWLIMPCRKLTLLEVEEDQYCAFSQPHKFAVR